MDTPPTPKTVALAAYIQRTVAALEIRPPSTDPGSGRDSLIFIGNRHNAHPSCLLQDPLLNSIHIHLWLIKQSHLGASGSPVSLPTIDQIADSLKCSRPTAMSAVLVLRLARWLTLCARVQHKHSGLYLGSLYALHDEPASLADTQQLQPDYLTFVQEMRFYKEEKVRSAANAIYLTLKDALQKDQDITRTPPRFERLAGHLMDEEDAGLFAAAPQFIPPEEEKAAGEGTGFNRVKNFDSVKSPEIQTEIHREQILDSVNFVLQTSNSSSSFNIYKKLQQPPACATGQAGVITPKELTLAEADTAQRIYLDELPVTTAQDLLDELGGRIQAGQKGLASRIKNPLSLLARYIALTKEGKVVLTSQGLQYRAQRQAPLDLTGSKTMSAPVAPPLPPAQDWLAKRGEGQSKIAKIKRTISGRGVA